MVAPLAGRGADEADLKLPLEVGIEFAPIDFPLPELHGEAMRHFTSDQLAKLLATEASEWTLRICRYKLQSITTMEIHSFEEAQESRVTCSPGRQVRAERSAADDLDDFIAAAARLNKMQDPTALGNANVGVRRRPRPGGRKTSGALHDEPPPPLQYADAGALQGPLLERSRDEGGRREQHVG